jgi:hypothetical protein
VHIYLVVRLGEKSIKRFGAKRAMVVGPIFTATGILLFSLTFFNTSIYVVVALIAAVFFGGGTGLFARHNNIPVAVKIGPTTIARFAPKRLILFSPNRTTSILTFFNTSIYVVVALIAAVFFGGGTGLFARPALSTAVFIIAIPKAPPSVELILKIPDATPTFSAGVVETAVLEFHKADKQLIQLLVLGL